MRLPAHADRVISKRLGDNRSSGIAAVSPAEPRRPLSASCLHPCGSRLAVGWALLSATRRTSAALPAVPLVAETRTHEEACRTDRVHMQTPSGRSAAGARWQLGTAVRGDPDVAFAIARTGGGARLKAIVSAGGPARSHSVKRSPRSPLSHDRSPSKPIVPSRPSWLPRLEPDGSRSRLRSRRFRASTDVAVRTHAVPRTDVTVLDQRLPLRLAKRSPRRRELGRWCNSSRSTAGHRLQNRAGPPAQLTPPSLLRIAVPANGPIGSLSQSWQWAIYLTQAEHDDMGDPRVGPRARVPPSRASHTAAGARFALTEGRLTHHGRQPDSNRYPPRGKALVGLGAGGLLLRRQLDHATRAD